jgi:hypothetical protein
MRGRLPDGSCLMGRNGMDSKARFAALGAAFAARRQCKTITVKQSHPLAGHRVLDQSDNGSENGATDPTTDKLADQRSDIRAPVPARRANERRNE